MISRSTMLPIPAVVALVLSACGEDGDDGAAPSESASAEVTADTTAETPAQTTADDSAGGGTEADSDDGASGDDGAESGCDQVLTSDEVDSILGTAVEIKGSGQVCQLVFASDSIGTLQAFSGSKADEAIDTLLAKFGADETASTRGVLLDDGRGYVDDSDAAVRGDSGRVFSLGIPANIDVADRQAAMEAIAELLLTR